MRKRKEPKNIEFIVTGRVIHSGATCIVHAKDRVEAIRKANTGKYLGGIEINGAQLCDWHFKKAEPNVDDDG
jgi:hypothetical protein